MPTKKSKVKRKPKQAPKHPPKRKTKTKSKKVTKRNHKPKVQRGGLPNYGSDFDYLPNNLLGLVETTVNSITDLSEAAYYTLTIGSDLGAAFGENEPNPDTVTIPEEVFD